MIKIFKAKHTSKTNRRLKSNLKRLEREARKRQAIAEKIF